MSVAPPPAQTWTVRKVLDWTRGHLDKHQVDAPRLTAELLLGHVLKATRVALYTDLDRPLHAEELAAYRALITRRLAGQPTQYLTGSTSFYGRPFQVDARVLIPRPETELLVEGSLRRLPRPDAAVVDVCTGSGCIALTLAAERPPLTVWATDLSPLALEVARANAAALKLEDRVTFLEGDLLAPLPPDARFALVVANPPYVRTDQLSSLQREVQQEPRLALDGGPDGLSLVRRLAAEALGVLEPGGWLALELAEEQGPSARALLQAQGYVEVTVEQDLARHDRLAFARKTPDAPGSNAAP